MGICTTEIFFKNRVEMNRLTKKQALELLPAIIDGEASSDEELAFLEFIKSDPDVRSEYEESLHIKQLLSERLPKIKAPEHLKNKVFNLLEEESETNFKDIPLSGGIHHSVDGLNLNNTPSTRWKSILRYLAAAAVILFITLTTIEFLDRVNDIQVNEIFVVETFTAQHFINSSGQLVEPHFSTNSISEAEEYLLNHYSLELTIPDISGAEFAGLVFADFIDGFETPLFEYVQHEIEETIYIFAFDINQITDHQKLKRHEKAVENCKTNTDFYVSEIEGYHVVSWNWNNHWYSAVSNHNGYDLASLIDPLSYSP